MSDVGQAVFEEIERLARTSVAAARAAFLHYKPETRAGALAAADRYYEQSPFWVFCRRAHDELEDARRTGVVGRLISRKLTRDPKTL